MYYRYLETYPVGCFHFQYSVFISLVVRRKCRDALSHSASCFLPIEEESHIPTIFTNESIRRFVYLLGRTTIRPFFLWSINWNAGIHISLLNLVASTAHAFFVFDHIDTSFHIFINRLPGLLILPSLGIPIPLFAEDVFMMEVFHDVQIQSLQYPARHIE